MQNIKTNCPKNSLAKTIRWLFSPMLELFQLSFTSLGNFFNYFVVAGCSAIFLASVSEFLACYWIWRSKCRILQKRSSKKGKRSFFPQCSSNWFRENSFEPHTKNWTNLKVESAKKKTSSFSNDKTNVNVVWSRGKKSIATEKLQITNLLLSRSLSKVLSPWQPRKMRPGKSSDCTLIDSCWFRRWRGKMQKSKLSATGRRRKPRKPMEKFAVREKKWLSENRQTEADIENTPLVLDPESDDKFS